jgi:hypothetical protein
MPVVLAALWPLQPWQERAKFPSSPLPPLLRGRMCSAEYGDGLSPEGVRQYSQRNAARSATVRRVRTSVRSAMGDVVQAHLAYQPRDRGLAQISQFDERFQPLGRQLFQFLGETEQLVTLTVSDGFLA